ncbi:1-acyl-sn-glycerol-3-phosphate acyltransferase [Paenibacillus sp. 598K]|uniref:lysophospholipid acyltransferase family protein n=1 Tax=Paenibacillus sp. 598K TaxID=1117987 RepID=UPI000FF9E6DE|nr:lysophospholipid acyltransferase family protein [Paenibacillus sp. 598K]GBF72746.1 1-acyl-sn-glycerol-3-phosphate acyltransferase [Paenibacillus sp. 598K]
MMYRICQTLLRIIFATLFPLKAEGLHNIPSTGPVLLCSNHISNIDPTTVGVKVRRKVHYMAKAELFSNKPADAFLRSLGAFPVKRGGVSKEALKLSIQILKEGHVVGIFPEGRRASSEDSAGKKGAAMMALRSGAVVIPVAIIGPYKPFRRMKIKYGEPIDMQHFIDHPSSDVLDRATEQIMTHIRALVREG